MGLNQICAIMKQLHIDTHYWQNASTNWMYAENQCGLMLVVVFINLGSHERQPSHNCLCLHGKYHNHMLLIHKGCPLCQRRAILTTCIHTQDVHVCTLYVHMYIVHTYVCNIIL